MAASSDIPFKDFLSVVAFAATITVSVSVTTSQAFATASTLFGVPLDGSHETSTIVAVDGTRNCAVWLAWAAALSGLSLMLTLLLQLLMTSPAVATPLSVKGSCLKTCFGIGSFTALSLQGGALAVIGQALKVVSHPSGLMLQWSLLATGLPALIFWLSYKNQKKGVKAMTVPHDWAS